MSKTQSDTGREEGSYVNKKAERKWGWQDSRQRDGGRQSPGTVSRVHTCPSAGAHPTLGTGEGLRDICWIDGWRVGGWMHGWMNEWIHEITQRLERKTR